MLTTTTAAFFGWLLLVLLTADTFTTVSGFTPHLAARADFGNYYYNHHRHRHHHHHKQQRGSSRNEAAAAAATATTTTARTFGFQLFSTVSSNQDLLPGIQAINNGNTELFARLEALRQSPYFRFYSVDILASCEYMPQELFECYTEGCEILPVDEEVVPDSLRAMDMDAAEQLDLDGWARWDMPTEDYYDIEEYPEGYTGYNGAEVWNFIHNRICFNDDTNFGGWKADFDKAVSGLHSMISAQVIRGIQDTIDEGETFKEDQIWRDPKAEFARRLHPATAKVPLALENLYFFFMLLLRAVSVARTRLLQEDTDTSSLRMVLDNPLLQDPAICAAAVQLQSHVRADKTTPTTQLWQARVRTQELLRIMNCVQCNKCRLHGKISTMGLSTALQLLMSNSDGDDSASASASNNLSRVELATLVTTLHKASRAVEYCRSMT